MRVLHTVRRENKINEPKTTAGDNVTLEYQVLHYLSDG